MENKEMREKESRWEELNKEIEESIEEAEKEGYDYTKTDEYESKKRVLDEISWKEEKENEVKPISEIELTGEEYEDLIDGISGLIENIANEKNLRGKVRESFVYRTWGLI